MNAKRSPSSVKVTGPLLGHVPRFVRELEDRGYAAQSIQKHLWLAAHLSRWMQGKGLQLADLTPPLIAAFLVERRSVGYGEGLSGRGLGQLLAYLRSAGAIPAASAITTPVDRLLGEFRHFLLAERGLTLSTAISYERKVIQLLTTWGNGDAASLGQMTAADVTRYVLSESARLTTGSTKNVVTALRALFRFLTVEGRIQADLVAAVPAVAGWRGGYLPRGLEADVVDRLLRSCDDESATGCRDLAILTLLARLGLRAGEVADMELDDFDWKAGTVVIRGKGAKRERLPLPVDVGEAVSSYLIKRPRVQCRRVFLRSCTPIGGLTGPCIGEVVRRACERAGLPEVGAHRLRHSAATGMLRKGASLGDVALILRHCSLEATAVYAKVDRIALRDLAQPWPEARS